MKRKVIAILVVATLSLTMLLGLSACGSTNGAYYNLTANGYVYFGGEQTITVSMSEYSSEKTTFKSTVSVADITLSEGLEGKTVKSVAYVDESSIKIVLDGNILNMPSEDNTVTGRITVSASALANGVSGYCDIYVQRPKLTVSGASHSHIGDTHSYSTTYTLPYGTFTSEATAENIILPDDNGTLTVELADEQNLYVKVSNYNPERNEQTSQFPIVFIPAKATTFDKDLYVYVGLSLLGADNGYSLM